MLDLATSHHTAGKYFVFSFSTGLSCDEMKCWMLRRSEESVEAGRDAGVTIRFDRENIHNFYSFTTDFPRINPRSSAAQNS